MTDVGEPGLGCIYEPMTIVFSIPDLKLNKAAAALEVLLKPDLKDENVVQRCLQKRILRTNVFNEALKETVSSIFIYNVLLFIMY